MPGHLNAQLGALNVLLRIAGQYAKVRPHIHLVISITMRYKGFPCHIRAKKRNCPQIKDVLSPDITPLVIDPENVEGGQSIVNQYVVVLAKVLHPCLVFFHRI